MHENFCQPFFDHFRFQTGSETLNEESELTDPLKQQVLKNVYRKMLR